MENDSHHHILCVLELRKVVEPFIKRNDASKTANEKRLHPSGAC